MNNTLCAIDPGASGGIAWQHPGEVACAVNMPDTEGDLVSLLQSLRMRNGVAYTPTFHLEDLVKHMGAGIPASTMAVYASNWGFLKGCIQYSGSPLHLVQPRKWINGLGLGKSEQTGNRSQDKRDWKRKLKSEAQRLYPHLEITLATSDALLILEWAKRQP